ncbi:NusA-like transcription termination signal-binding factor [Candidatus Woesearchaeota archaeon]|nr:NusA-like transcription termination signal-binding factor [Candidatus Woesearchaeota archaeon]
METYNLQTIGFITTFERVTRTNVKRLLLDKKGKLVFIVEEGQAGKAIGKAGMNMRKLQRLFKKRIRVIEFNQNPIEFVKNYITPLEVESITEKDDQITISSQDTKTKGMLIGRNKQNIQELNSIVQKLFKRKVIIA